MKTRLLVALVVLAACGDPEGGGNDDEPSGGTGGNGGSDAGGISGSGGSGGSGTDGGGPPPTSTCAQTECDPNADCDDSSGTATCTCKDGWEGDGESCTDVDECETDNGGCDADAACVNQQGSVRCLCDEGMTGDGQSCSPIKFNECGDAELNTCDPNAECTDTNSGFTCACPGGYDGDGKSCGDVDECDAGDDDCVANAECDNTFGSFTCSCAPGYTGDGKVACTSVCAGACAGDFLCSVVGQQVPNTGVDTDPEDTETVPQCSASVCAPGFIYNGSSACVAIAGGDNCGQCDGAGGDDAAGAVCSGTPGSGSCSCGPGYTGSVGSCADVDECATNNGDCGGDTENLCVNLPGGHACDCQPGYARDAGGTCVDENECNLVPGPCHPNAECTNTTGSFTCACKDGFSGDGKICADIDECAEGDDDCLDDGTARCVNTNGSFECQCRRGYEGNGKDSCDNLNECEAGALNDCAASATCTDTTPEENPFGYTCTCGAGQSGDGTQCSDLNECENASLFDCPSNSTCVNTEGGYDCQCKAPFTGDDADSCYCDLSGYWAMRQDLDLCWCDQDLLDVTIIQGGTVEASVWELHKYTYDGTKIVVEKKGCGEDNQPDLISPAFEGVDNKLETYSSYVPNPVYEAFDLFPGKDIDEPGIVPGSMFRTPDEAAVSGIDLGNDPENAEWPAASDEPGIEWIDDDGDGEPGFTVWSHTPSQKTEASTTAEPDYFDYPPVNLDGDGKINERSVCISTASRVITHLDADVDTCEHIVGNVTNVKTDARVISCLKVEQGANDTDDPNPKDPTEDFTCNADDWDDPPGDTGARCTADDVKRLDETDQSQQSQATFELVKIAALADGEPSCADVRKALPAFKRNPPTPISCSCP